MQKLFFLSFISFLLIGVCSCSEQKYPKQLGSNYYIEYNDSWGYAAVVVENAYVVDMEIVAWNFDSRFIITKQKPFMDILDSISTKYPDMSATKTDRMYDEIKIYSYWIIDKRVKSEWDTVKKQYTGIIYGPLSKEKYWEKRKELGVSDSLKK